ncbi:hypothetical protein PENTCL1PPCAC_19303, partial [Pristionchus entomophagus]
QMTREKYSERDLRSMVDFLHRACTSKDRKLQKLADVPKGMELWKLMENEQGRSQQRFGVKCDHSALSMNSKYRKYLHEKMHHVDGVSAEKVLCIYKYVGTELPKVECNNIRELFPNYHVVFDRSTGDKQKVISYQLKTIRTRNDDEEEEEEDGEADETELHVSRASDDEENDSQGPYRMNLNPVMRTPGGTRRTKRPSEPMITRIANHIRIIQAHDPTENLTDTPMWRRPRQPVDVAAIRAAAAAPAADPSSPLPLTPPPVKKKQPEPAAEKEKNSRVTRKTAATARVDLDESLMVIGEKKKEEEEPQGEQVPPVKKKPNPLEEMLEDMNRMDDEMEEREKRIEKERAERTMNTAFMDPAWNLSADDSLFEPLAPVGAAGRQRTAAAAAATILDAVAATAASAAKEKEEEAAAEAAAGSASASQRPARRRILVEDDVEMMQEPRSASPSPAEKWLYLEQLLKNGDPAEVASEWSRLSGVPISKTTQVVKCLREPKIEDIKKDLNEVKEEEAVEEREGENNNRVMEQLIKREVCNTRVDTAEMLMSILMSRNTGDGLVEIMGKRCEIMKEIIEEIEGPLDPMQDDRIIDRVLNQLDETIETLLLDDFIFEEGIVN